MQFDDAVSYLLGLGHETVAIKLGLKNIEALLAELGNPQQSFRSVQIAGTNGKGSTAVMLGAICRCAGLNTGLYTSPHLVSPTERIVVNGQEISREYFAQLVSKVKQASETLVAGNELAAMPTFFEHLTAVAFLAFAQANVDIAILETGMGGRLDATTAARASVVAITPISLDHQQYLGETIADIAFEKAAIIRPGVRAVVAEQVPEALAVIQKRTKDCEVTPALNDWTTTVQGATTDGRFIATFETPIDSYRQVTLGMRGRHQSVNAGIAIRATENLRELGIPIARDTIIEGITEARHAGRLELIKGSPNLLLDGAHNAEGARALRAYLDEFVEQPITLVFGAMRDKQLSQMGKALFGKATTLVLTMVDSPRSATVSELQQLASSLDCRSASATASASEALRKALALTPPQGTICVTGSLYLVGEIKSALAGAAVSKPTA